MCTAIHPGHGDKTRMKMVHQEEIEPNQANTSEVLPSDILQMFLGPFLWSEKF